MTLFIYKSELNSLLDAIKMFEHSDIIFSVEIDNKKTEMKDYLLKITFGKESLSALQAIYKAGFLQAEKELKRENV